MEYKISLAFDDLLHAQSHRQTGEFCIANSRMIVKGLF